MATLKQLVIKHDNNYRFDISKTDDSKIDQVRSLSVVIPYYETASTINLLLENLYKSLNLVKNKYPDWLFEVIIIDDGSVKHLLKNSIKNSYENLVLCRFENNKGIGAARNYGIGKAQYDQLMFLDSDIIMSPRTILDHLVLHTIICLNDREIITCGLFNFVSLDDASVTDPAIFAGRPNDFRVHCVYDETWIGCEADKQYIGREFNLIKETEDFKKWPHGYYGPWLITNMVLGGLFMASTDLCKKVGGVDNNFIKYGFVETSLVTKLVARYNTYVVPVTNSFSLHVEDKKVAITKDKKDILFRNAHKKYFEDYLNKELKDVTPEQI